MASTAGATWSKDEILKLIEMWGQETIQKQLQECKRNQSIFEDVAKQMREAGYERTFQQCREKIKKLKGEYKKEKDKHNRTGEGRTNWDYFEAMDAILGHRPATQPPVVIDTSESATPAPETQEEDDEGGEEGEQPAASEGNGADSLNSSTTSLSSSLPGAGSSTRKRKRPAKTDTVVVELMERVISAQTKSDEKMMELEEKRMRMEERQMEREAQQRREDREFQMQMIRMMMMGPGMHSFQMPGNQHNLGNPSPMDQSSSSSFEYGTSNMYNAYTRTFEDNS